MANIINYAEYLMWTEGKRPAIRPKRELTDEEEAYYDQKDQEFVAWYNSKSENPPDWFNYWQDRALNLIRKKISQLQVFPRNRRDFLDLKEDFWIEEGTHIAHTEPYNFKEMVGTAIAEQIKFMKENEISFQNGYLNAANSINIGGYSQSMTPDNMIKKLFNELAPLAYDNLEAIGWMYSGIDCAPLDPSIFYKGEH